MTEQNTPEPVEVDEAPTLEDRVADLETRLAAVEDPEPEPEAPENANADE
jgi:hypothetical protein